MNLSDYTKDGASLVFGWLGYGERYRTDRACLLREGESAFELVIPFQGESDDIAEWFVGPTVLWGFGNETPKPLPERLWLFDISSNDKYCLVHPRIVKRSLTGMADRGYGVISPDYVVKGEPGQNYCALHAVRSRIPEYAEWTSLGSLTTEYEFKEDGWALQSFSAGFKAEDEIPIMKTQGFTLSWRPTDGCTIRHEIEPEVIIRDTVLFQTVSDESRSFREHLQFHKDIKALLSIITWRDVSFKRLWVRNNDDVLRDPEGKARGPRWRTLITKSVEDWKKPSKRKQYLILFEEVGLEGLAKWFDLKQEYRIPLDQITYISRSHESLTLESQILLYGVALEELGVYIGEQSANRQLAIAQCVDTILLNTAAPFRLADKVSNGVAQRIANTYNSIKHPRPQRGGKTRSEWLDIDNMFEVVNACRLLALMWIASRIGCGEGFVKRVREDNRASGAFKTLFE